MPNYIKDKGDNILKGSYSTFKKDVYDITKIDLNYYKERQMKRRIISLLTKGGFNSYDEYIKEIRTNKSSLEGFLNHITINVSEFFRNPEQWMVLEETVLPYLFDKFGKNLKIWSAACSTGDEPYSLVMLLSKYMPMRQIKIIATDLDKQILEKAQVGLYNVKSLKALPKEFIDKFFTKVNDTTYQISDEVKSRVEFKHHNLLKDSYPTNCDLVVCRNVLIYFTDEAKDYTYSNFNKSLNKEAVLFVGSTEQIIHSNQLGFDSFKSFFYKKNN